MEPYPRQPAPPASLNGGLYAGKPFDDSMPWRNFPAEPEAGFYMHSVLLRTAEGGTAPGAQHHVPGGGFRPGNNTPMLPASVVGGAGRFPGLSVVCAPNDALPAPGPAAGSAGRGFSALYHFGHAAGARVIVWWLLRDGWLGSAK